ncbi:MAG TPA: ABC transporter permease [Bryobacteraceae bacterium]|nr:ABC transporter permease [Bryobacteraceae bacterium]
MPEFLVNLWLRTRALFLRRKLERDLDDEIRFHLEMRQQKLERAGLAPEQASAAARRRLGNPTLLSETSRSLWTFAWLEALGRDLRYALRAMAAAPLFTAVAVATLAFGIGANTAIFSIVNGVLLRQMPYENPAGIYSIRETVEMGAQRETMTCVNGGNVLEWTRDAHSFQSIAALMPSNDSLILGSETVGIHGARASASLPSVLGIRPRIGRWFTPEEDSMGQGLRMVLTDALWRDRFGADTGIVGHTVSLNGYATTVVGVLPAGFYFPKQNQIYAGRVAGWDARVEYFTNLNLGPWETKPGVGNFNFAAIGRIRPGVTRERAVAELEAIENGISRQASTGATLHAMLVPFRAAVVGPAEKRIWMLMAGAALVMAIVCVNLAGLMLGRNTARAREVAIRLALGAGRWTVLRQFAAEGLVLAFAGGVIGVLSALAGVRLLVRYAPITLPRLETVTIDAQVLLFSAAIALGAGLLFSLLPALRLEDREIEETLRSATPNVSSSRRNVIAHDLLAGSEITLCTVLLICAVLLGQSLSRVLRDNAWLNEQRVVTIEIGPSPKQYQKSAARIELYRNLLRDTRELAGVTAAGLINALPLKGGMWGGDVDFAEAPRAEINRPTANFRFISPDYDDGIGLGLVDGRRLRESDFGRPVMWISENLARQYPGRNPLGMHMQWRVPDTGKKLSLEVAGVVRDARTEAEQAPTLTVYIPYWIWPPWNPALVVRTAGPDPAGVAAGVQRMIRRTHGEVPVLRVETLRQMLDSAVASRRFLTRLGVVFAASATFLAALGIYGVVSLATARRRREIAIRIAVGASHPEIFRMVIGKAARLAVASAAVGLAGGMAVERAMLSLLYEVRPGELATYAGACGIVMAVALGASFVPALRAARVDPVVALKYE